ncbi:hypothetical protein ACGFXC_37355 [Streptomyces sp. NPDC048507]|uniref:hypothetical protein n=1 Tax=Streptomyces sp. NPDC048507 TaxID=3365560 RepID=UPI00371D62F9
MNAAQAQADYEAARLQQAQAQQQAEDAAAAIRNASEAAAALNADIAAHLGR